MTEAIDLCQRCPVPGECNEADPECLLRPTLGRKYRNKKLTPSGLERNRRWKAANSKKIRDYRRKYILLHKTPPCVKERKTHSWKMGMKCWACGVERKVKL